MDHAGIQRQTFHPRRVPVQRQRQLPLGHTQHPLAVGQCRAGAALLGVQQRDTAHGPQAPHRLALNRQLQALMAVLAGGHKGVAAIDQATRLVGAEQGGCVDGAASIVFDADFLLSGHVR